jgi:uncharacterized 2Fe-2S/4Fe-4S cluster protein (DUF4445 family)
MTIPAPQPDPDTGRFLVDLEPSGRRVEVEAGTTLLEATQRAGVDLVAACGGVGVCGTCLVRRVSGLLSEPTQTEQDHLSSLQLNDGQRLACEARPLSHVKIEILPESLPVAQRMQVEGEDLSVLLEPGVVFLDVTLSEPSQEDLRSDFTRAREAVAAQDHRLSLQADPLAVNLVANNLRRQGWCGRLVLKPNSAGDRLVTVLPSATDCLGLAVDLGSTKIAVYLVDLHSGATLASAAAMNPQIAYGEDVVSRIAFADKTENNRRLLQSRLVETLNKVSGDLCQQAGVGCERIVDVVVVGNTAMHHFFCGLPVTQLGAAPYVPAISDPFEMRAADVGLKTAPGAWVYLPANIAGYVGADHTSALLSSGAYASERTMVVVDIGTNTEISLIKEGKITSCSTASGPAFEGAHIQDGMRAAFGAIERVRINQENIYIGTIGNVAPVGLCGTGILNAISEMLELGFLDRRGVLRKERGAKWFNGKGEFVLVPASQSAHGREIVVTRRDVHEIQLAKGAIRAGIEILLMAGGIPALLVDRWIIAGAFGTYLDLNSAIRVGMLPPVDFGSFRQVGNAAGMGAKQMLLSNQKRTEAERMARRVNYIELTSCASFTPIFMEELYFPEHNDQADVEIADHRGYQ